MIKAKEISIKNIAVMLAFLFAISAGYYLTRPHAVAKSVPIFMGEEIVVKKALTAVRGEKAVRAERAVKVVKAVKAVKAETVPIPVPKDAAPLPIVPPSITFKVLPVYPTTALEKGLEGTVLLSVYIGLSGQPEKIETKVSSGVPELDDSAIKAISQWKFSPATQGGQPLAGWMEIPVTFKLITD